MKALKSFPAPSNAPIDQRYLNSGRSKGTHNLTITKDSIVVWNEFEINGEKVAIPQIQGFSVPKLIGAGCDALCIEDTTVHILKEWTGKVVIDTKTATDRNGQTYETKTYVIK